MDLDKICAACGKVHADAYDGGDARIGQPIDLTRI